MPLKIVFVPSPEWYTSKWFAKGTGQNISEQMEKMADILNKFSCFGVEAVVDKEVLKQRIYANYLFIEVCLVASPFGEKDALKLIDEDKTMNSDPEKYVMRVVLDGNSLEESGAVALQQILDAIFVRSGTYVSTRVALGGDESVANVPTPDAVGFYEAIIRSCPRDGGLYMPRAMPTLTKAELAYLAAPREDKAKGQYLRTAQFIMEKLIGLPRRYTVDLKVSGLYKADYDEAMQKMRDDYAKAQMDYCMEPTEAKEAAMKDAQCELDGCARRLSESAAAANRAFIQKINDMGVPGAVTRYFSDLENSYFPERFGAREVPAPCDIKEMLQQAYNNPQFGSNKAAITPIPFGKMLPQEDSDGIKAAIDITAIIDALKDIRVMEMHVGPTGCYEDFSFTLFKEFFDEAHKYVNIVATNGDAGAAAINAFITNGSNAKAQLFILYPEDGITVPQKAHITHYANLERVHAIGVKGSFEFCQRAATKMLRDPELLSKITNGKVLTCANAVNWGRIIPMVATYAHAFVECSIKGEAKRKIRNPLDTADDAKRNAYPTGFDVVVPTGNLGNLVAAYTAVKMGIPIRTIVVATNDNDIMTEFVQTGTFNAAKRFPKKCFATPLDVTTATNIERLLYLIHDGNTNTVRSLMNDLQRKHCFSVSQGVFEAKIKPLFWSVKCNETQTKEAILSIFGASGRTRLMDPVTAVSVSVLDDYYRMVKKDSMAGKAAAKAAEKNKKKGVVTEDREYIAIYPVVLMASAHWMNYPVAVMRSVKVPLISHDDAGMPTPAGYEPPATCCREPAKPKAPEFIDEIARRQVATLVKKCSSAQNKLTELQKSILMGKNQTRNTPAVVQATYPAVADELLKLVNNSYVVAPSKDAEKNAKAAAEKKKKFDETRKKSATDALKKPYVKQEDLDAWTPTAFPIAAPEADNSPFAGVTAAAIGTPSISAPDVEMPTLSAPTDILPDMPTMSAPDMPTVDIPTVSAPDLSSLDASVAAPEMPAVSVPDTTNLNATVDDATDAAKDAVTPNFGTVVRVAIAVNDASNAVDDAKEAVSDAVQ